MHLTEYSASLKVDPVFMIHFCVICAKLRANIVYERESCLILVHYDVKITHFHAFRIHFRAIGINMWLINVCFKLDDMVTFGKLLSVFGLKT